jgi:hypothetical protein
MKKPATIFGTVRARATLGPQARLLDWARSVPLPDTRMRHLALSVEQHVRIVGCATDQRTVAKRRGDVFKNSRRPNDRKSFSPNPRGFVGGLGENDLLTPERATVM